jgi:pimeloyl-ACP methyl ester carboxylesterase
MILSKNRSYNIIYPILIQIRRIVISYEIQGSKKNNHIVSFMHGILGSKRNWRTPSRVWTKKYPLYSSLTLDHRGHGDSYNIKSSVNTIHSCVEDYLQLLKLEEITIPDIVLAHSFSGKVVIQYLIELEKINGIFPKHVWVLDSIPRPYQPSPDTDEDSSVHHIFDILDDLPKSFESKEWVINALVRRGISQSVALWLASNIITASIFEKDEEYTWKFDLDTIKQLFQDYCDRDMWPLLEQYSGPSILHFVRAGKNKSWTTQIIHDFERLQQRNKRIKLHHMPHVGHWLHAEDLNGLLSMVSLESEIKAGEREKR